MSRLKSRRDDFELILTGIHRPAATVVVIYDLPVLVSYAKLSAYKLTVYPFSTSCKAVDNPIIPAPKIATGLE